MINTPEPKLWLCGITQNRRDDIDEMTKDDIAQHFDGLIFVDAYSDDGTYELLESRKKEGTIIQRKWTNDHDTQMNEFLRQGPMRNGDWFVTLDSPDRLVKEWAEQLREEVVKLKEEKIGAISMATKVYLAQYFDHMFYFQTPHWGLNGIVNGIKSYTEEEKKNCVTSVRFDDPVKSGLLNPVKYYYVYGRSNHCNLLYQQFGNQVLNKHESQRLQFRIYCQHELGLELTIDSLVEYMRDESKWSEYFLDSVELEVNLKDIYRYKVLNQSYEDIVRNRFDWSIKEFFETGDKDQQFNNYIGPFTEYKKIIEAHRQNT